jgi:hypothetical protein
MPDLIGSLRCSSPFNAYRLGAIDARLIVDEALRQHCAEAHAEPGEDEGDPAPLICESCAYFLHRLDEIEREIAGL